MLIQAQIRIGLGYHSGLELDLDPTWRVGYSILYSTFTSLFGTQYPTGHELVLSYPFPAHYRYLNSEYSRAEKILTWQRYYYDVIKNILPSQYQKSGRIRYFTGAHGSHVCHQAQQTHTHILINFSPLSVFIQGRIE